MLTQLHIKNFKAWKDTQPIALKPVTMLLGANSSGKSSMIQSLLLLKQTALSPDRTIHLNLGGDEANDYFNFGDFENVLTVGANDPRRFELAFSFKRPADERVKDGHFRCSYGQISSGAVAVQELELASGDHRLRAVRRDKGAYSLMVDDEALPRGKSRDYAPERSIAFPPESLVALGAEGSLAQDLSLAIRRELEGIVYLGPLRRKPERDYLWNKTLPGEIGSDGHKAIDVLLDSAISRKKDHSEGELLTGVSEWLARMKVADKLEVRQLGRSSRYEVVVHRAGVAANLRDVGIGISQVLPVLTVAHFAPEGSTVILEEPEIHLHPLAQSLLAELFVEISKKRGVHFIVETHSEHLFRRMQTLIAQRKTDTTHCGMYFVERDGAHAVLKPLEVDDYGTVGNWPPNFFGDAVGEARDQAKARADRMWEKANANT